MFGSKKREFEALVRACSGELYRYGYWLSRDRFIAEDLVQETFARAWTSRHTLRDDKAARSWLFTILRNEHARLYERKRLEMADTEDLDTVADPRLNHWSGELEMNEALHKLPLGYREPLMLQVLGGFTCDEIAAVMNISPGAVMTRLSRARIELRRICSAESRKEDTG